MRGNPTLRLRRKLTPEVVHIVKNVGWLTIARVAQVAVAMGTGIWLARYLGPAAYGIYNYAIAFVVLFGSFASLGLQGIVVRDLVRKAQPPRIIIGTTFGLRLLGGIGAYALTVTVISYSQDVGDPLVIMVQVLAVRTVFMAFDAIDMWFQSRVEARYSVYAGLFSLLFSTSLNVFLIVTQAPLQSFIVVLALEAAVESVALVAIYSMRGNRILDWRFSFPEAANLLSQSWILILSAMGAALNLKIDQVMLGNMQGAEAVGIYSAAVRLSEGWYFVAAIIASSVFPSMITTKLQGIEVYNRRLQRYYDLMVALAYSIAIAVLLVGNPMIHALYGSVYQEAATILSIHVWAGVFVFMGQILSKWLINEGLLKASLVRHGVGAVVNIVLNLFLIPRWGGIGAAVATVFSYAAASYFFCFLDSRTVQTGKMMTLALILPVRLIRRKHAV